MSSISLILTNLVPQSISIIKRVFDSFGSVFNKENNLVNNSGKNEPAKKRKNKPTTFKSRKLN
jgi:hypothetical protein